MGGSGSGFIGKFAAVHAPGNQNLQVTLIDIDPAAMEYCRSPGFNAPRTGHGGRSVSWELRSEDAVEVLNVEFDFDLFISNPPYVPTRDEVRGGGISQSSGFWEGIGLVVYLIGLVLHRKCSHGVHLIIMVTSLTLKAPQVQAALVAAAESGVRVRQLV